MEVNAVLNEAAQSIIMMESLYVPAYVCCQDLMASKYSQNNTIISLLRFFDRAGCWGKGVRISAEKLAHHSAFDHYHKRVWLHFRDEFVLQ